MFAAGKPLLVSVASRIIIPYLMKKFDLFNPLLDKKEIYAEYLNWCKQNHTLKYAVDEDSFYHRLDYLRFQETLES